MPVAPGRPLIDDTDISGEEQDDDQPSTWTGVTSLAAPGYLVEVDAVAVLP